MAQTVEKYHFTPDMLAPERRMPGVSAFMRIRNGADFLEATIRSHAEMYDEIVAVYNRCTDNTPDILMQLSKELGPKLRVYHYVPEAHPAGSEEHARTPGDAPTSLVNYSNFALCQTRYQWVVKLDDDHLAIPDRVQGIVRTIRKNDPTDQRKMHCFSGLNLSRNSHDELAVPKVAPVSGKGDIGYFCVTKDTYFTHDPRFERFVRGSIKRVFSGWFYWHLKYLKAGGGFANYDLSTNPTSRYARRRERMAQGGMMTLSETKNFLYPGTVRRLAGLIDNKADLVNARDLSIGSAFPQGTLQQALDATTPEWKRWLEAKQ